MALKSKKTTALKPKKTNLFYKVILVSFIIFAAYFGNVVFFPHQIPKNSYQLIVDKNESITSIASDLEKNNIIVNGWVFRQLLRIQHKDRKVVAGMYFLKDSMSTWGIAARITNGKPDQISVTFIDGWSLNQVRDYVNSLANVQHITNKLSDEELKNMLKIDWPNLEGAFYPSTYFIAPNQTDLEIYQQANKLMKAKLTNLYLTRATNTTYTSPYQLLIMASLIQKETGDRNDMKLVSTVFNNRIKKGMKLQDDPAVFYGLKNQVKVTRKDFQIDTPYNTYLRFGLPPTPICIPSQNALLAASQPLNKPDLLFFVAIGSGKTKFSTSYGEHQSAVNQYLKK